MNANPTGNSGKRNNIFIILIILFSGVLYSGEISAQCSTVDQSQLNYNGGMSARNLPEYTVWQYFTAGTTGTLCKLDVGFFNQMSGTGTLNIFAGIGTGGTLLQTQPVTVSGNGNFFYAFYTSVPMISGDVYTFQFIPVQGGGLPDPYGVQIESPGSYNGGEMYITDPSGTYATGFDMVFKTYVTVTTQLAEINTPASTVNIFPNPFSSETTLKTNINFNEATLILVNVYGEKVREIPGLSGNEIKIGRENLKNGVYFVGLKDGSEFLNFQKLVLTGN